MQRLEETSQRPQASRRAKCAAEFLGTFFLVFTIGCGVHTYSAGAAVSAGAMLAALAYSLGSVSGAHFNPAVTLAVLASGRKKISLRDSLLYMLAQACAGISATSACAVLMPADHSFVPAPGPYGAATAFAVEAIYSAALCYVVLGVSTTRDADPSTGGNAYFGLAIGWTLTTAFIAGGPISGCSLNPAAGLGAVLAPRAPAGPPVHYWSVAIIAPYVGALFAAAGFFAVRGGLEGKDEYGADDPLLVLQSAAPIVKQEEPDVEAPVILSRGIRPPVSTPAGPVKLEASLVPIAVDPDIYDHELCCEIAWWTKEGAWDMASDLDITCVTFDKHGNHKSHVGFDSRQDKNGIKHGGDRFAALMPAPPTPRDGQTPLPAKSHRACENIMFKLSSIKQNVHFVFFVVNVFSAGRFFDQVHQINFRILDSVGQQGKQEICYFDRNDMGHQTNGLIAAMIYRKGEEWCMCKVDEHFALSKDMNSTYREMEPRMQQLCKMLATS